MNSSRQTVATASVISDKNLDEYVNLATHLADCSGEICRKYFRQEIKIEEKDDSSPVTEADVEVEKVIRQEIRKKYPGHSIFGEELGMSMGEGEEKRFLWVIDPIDGTLSFVTGRPLFCTLIALVYDGIPIVGIIDQPILQDRWVGAADRQTQKNGLPVNVRSCEEISHAYMYSYAPEAFLDDRQQVYERLSPKVKHHVFGGDSYCYGLLASGMVDVVCDSNMEVYDYMALIPIVEGAGGCTTNWRGEKITWDGVKLNGAKTWDSDTVASATPELHKQVLTLMDWR